MSLMYNFALKMWRERRVDEAYILYQVEVGRLTQEEAKAVIASPQNLIVE